MNFAALLSFRIKYKILLTLQCFKRFDYFSEVSLDPARPKAYLFLAADYGNLGDVAITYAQTKFIKDNSQYQVIEIPISKSLEGLHFVKKNIKKNDLITTVGGGNMGDLYDQIEYIRQLVIKFFPKNKIISFPQTFDFSETSQGRKALQTARKVYNQHRDFTIIAREETSFKLMKKNFPQANVILTPDIVLSLNEIRTEQERSGVVICMRKDAEKSLTPDQNEFIIQTASEHFSEVSYYDTHIGKTNLSVAERLSELNRIWDKFRGAELVITDRLHGMIFCYITNTPCLVFQNNNHKVKETHRWIQNAEYITLLSAFSKDVVVSYFSDQKYKTVSEHFSLMDRYKLLTKKLKS